MIFNKNKLDSLSCLLNGIKTLNIFKINIFQILIFTFKTKDQLNPTIFAQKFQSIVHQFPTCSSSFYEPNRKKEFLKFLILRLVPRLWNKILPVSVKDLDTVALFKAKGKKLIGKS